MSTRKDPSLASSSPNLFVISFVALSKVEWVWSKVSRRRKKRERYFVEEIAIEEGVESWEDVRIVEIVIPDERPETIEAQKYNDALLVDESLRKSIRRMGLGICEMRRECAMRRVRLYWSWVRGSWRRESQADWRARRCD